ncbi:AAA family ATPase [Vibrio vulnificus]|nr:AAA family ATPase [Vibrio vulnificus]EJO9875020.1 AAA family ATPase [Vibrio vulnificus]
MKLLNSKFLLDDIVELTIIDRISGSIIIGEPLSLLEDNGTYYIRQLDAFFEVEMSSADLKRTLYTQSLSSAIAVAVYETSNSVAIRYAFVQSKMSNKHSLMLDQLTVSNIAATEKIQSDFSSVRDWFYSQFLFTDEYGQSAFLLGSDESKGYQKLSILGENKRALITRHQGYWIIEKIEPIGHVCDVLYQYSGEHNVVDAESPQKEEAKALNLALEQHMANHGSYFKLWQQYSDIYWRQNEDLAKSAGYIEYESCKAVSDEVIRFELTVSENQLEMFKDNCTEALEKTGGKFSWSAVELQLSDELPSYLSSEEETTLNSIKKPILLSNIQVRRNTITADFRDSPPKKGYVFISLNGIIKQHQRKTTAFEMLRSRKNDLPQLQAIFEGVNPPVIGSRKTLRPITPSLKRSLGNKSLNRAQEKALKIALNTPDIALIIGPPGTGKTQVISAIQQRLAEEGEKTGESIQYQTLLTSYQHDAVDNVVARTRVFGLPAVKVGGKYGKDVIYQNQEIKSWVSERIELLQAQWESDASQYEELTYFAQLSSSLHRIKSAPSLVDLIDSLQESERLMTTLLLEYGVCIPEQYSDKFNEFKRRFCNPEQLILDGVNRKHLARTTRALRTTDCSYRDDGLARVKDLIDVLQTVSNASQFTDELTILYRRSAQPEEYEDIQQRLLIAIKPMYMSRNIAKIGKREAQLFEDLIDSYEQELKTKPKLATLYFRKQYIDTLTESERQVRSAIVDYVSVLGATCQQAAGDAMIGIQSTESSSNLRFNSVIVDEAARANPLDLMIPMAMARKRVILVGDHRQLPHMLEPQVESELQESQEPFVTQSELLKQSLFERLYHTLKQFESETNVKRVAMLDTQYRMHPKLGKFVSHEFYEAFGLPEVKSGLEEDKFSLDVPGYEGCVGAWLDIPISQGNMKSKNGSKYRECEAQAVVDEAYRLLNERPDLSVGIITFYAAQRDLIQEKMCSKGVMSKIQGDFEVNAEYQFLNNGDERFRVGSVDAFQGKEFDVVLLSPVRSWHSGTELNEDSLNRALGFLRIPNRINVAMSRQKRLLIVVGDQSLSSAELEVEIQVGTSDEDSEKALIGFPAFYRTFCKQR